MHGRSRRTPSCRGCSESVPSSSPGPRSTRGSSRPRSTTAATPGGRSSTTRTARAGASWTPIAARLTRPERGSEGGCAVLARSLRSRAERGDHALADLRPQLLEVDARAGLHIAPVGEVTDERQRLWPRAADDDRDPAQRRRLLAGALHVVESAVVVDDLARPQRTQDLEGLAQPLHP